MPYRCKVNCVFFFSPGSSNYSLPSSQAQMPGQGGMYPMNLNGGESYPGGDNSVSLSDSLVGIMLCNGV